MNDSAVSRRRLLQGLTALWVMPLGALAANGSKPGVLPWLPGLQLYTLQLKPEDDLKAALDQVAATGYRIVELAGNYGRSAEEIRRLLDGAGLKAPSCHVSSMPAPNNWDLAGDPSELAAAMRTLGARNVVLPIPLLPAHAADALRHPPPGGFDARSLSAIFEEVADEDWIKTAEFLNAKAAALAHEGLRVAYHNHGVDFRKLPSGKTGFDIMVNRLDPKLVDFEIDLGWAVAAGQDIGMLFQRLGSRISMLHLKDVKQLATVSMELIPTDAGSGIVPWREVQSRVRHAAVKYMFVEHEPPFAHTPMDAAKADYRFLANLFGVSPP